MSAEKTNLEQMADKQIAAISPFQKESDALLERAKGLAVNNKEDRILAANTKRDAVAHRKLVHETRMNMTRALDDLKSNIMTKEQEVLHNALEAERIAKEKIDYYDSEQRRLKEAEEKRITAIVDTLVVDRDSVDRKEIPVEDVDTLYNHFKKAWAVIDAKDRKLKRVKAQIQETRAYFEELRAFAVERDRQAAERERLKEEERALAAKKAELADQEKQLEADRQRNEEAKKAEGAPAAQDGAAKPSFLDKPVADLEKAAEVKAPEVTGDFTRAGRYEFRIANEDMIERKYCDPSIGKLGAAVAIGDQPMGVEIREYKANA